MKLSEKRFLKELIISDAVATMAYMVLLMLLNLLSEGKLAMSTGALVELGWNAEDVPHAVMVMLTAAILLFDAAVSLLVYGAFLWQLRRDGKRRETFLKEIGTTPFDKDRFTAAYMRREGYATVGLYGGILLVLSVLGDMGVPFAALPIAPQTLLWNGVIGLTPLEGALRQVILTIGVVILHSSAMYGYQRCIVPHVYARWASERFRVDTTPS